ncbi:MAG: NAD-dependent deacylase [Caldilineaceae bacterium]|nr:NAD-dependent deacylase [Caldilineaceae bacterium]
MGGVGEAIVRAAQFFSADAAVVCLTGAGVSAESGVPTFRDAQTGLWSRFDAEELATPQGFARDPGLVWRWYMWRLEQLEAAVPNTGHAALARLAGLCESFLLVTQNVDDLHEQAGSVDVLHLHGSLFSFRCASCAAPHNLTAGQRGADFPPACGVCSELVRPGVVWFGESLPWDAVEEAARAAHRCSVMLVVGTSGLVYPASQLPLIARQAGASVIDVNPEPGPISSIADIFLQGKSGEVLPALVRAVADRRASA